MVSHCVILGGGDCFFIISLCILKFGSPCCLVLMWSHFVKSMWLVEINISMMNWAIDWDMMGRLVVRGFMMSFNVMWSSIDIVSWVCSVMRFWMTIETWMMRCFMVWSCMV